MWKIKNQFYLLSQKMATNVAYTQLDNVKYSAERFFQLQNGYIVSQAFVWSTGK